MTRLSLALALLATACTRGAEPTESSDVPYPPELSVQHIGGFHFEPRCRVDDAEGIRLHAPFVQGYHRPDGSVGEDHVMVIALGCNRSSTKWRCAPPATLMLRAKDAFFRKSVEHSHPPWVVSTAALDFHWAGPEVVSLREARDGLERKIGEADRQRWSAERLTELRETIDSVFTDQPDDAVAIRDLAYVYVLTPSRETAWQFFVSLRGGGGYWSANETTCFQSSDAWRKSLR